MKRLLLTTFSIVIALSAFSQNRFPEVSNIKATPIHKKQEYTTDIEEPIQGSFKANAAVNIIWQEDFANGIPAEWENFGQGANGNTQNWEYRGPNTTPDTSTGTRGAYGNRRINSFSWENGFIIYDSDYYDNGGVPGNFGQGPAAAPQTAHIQTDTIDLSGYQEVVLEFYHFFRQFQSTTNVLVSGNAGATWDTIPVNSQFPINVAGQEDEYEAFDISDPCGGASQVLIRFAIDANYYHWQIDDIRIIEKPDNDLELSTAQILQGNRIAFYGQVYPEQYTNFELAGNIANDGTLDQPNTKLDVSVSETGGPSVYSNSSAGILLKKDSLEEISFTDFDPNAYSKAIYEVVYNTYSDSADIDPDPTGFRENNNTGTRSFLLTDSTYARDLGQATSSLGTGSFFDSEDGFRMANLMEVVQPDTITSVRINISPRTDVGGNYQVTIRDTSNGFAQGFTSGGNWPVVLQSEIHTVTEEDTMRGYLNVPIPKILNSSTPQDRVLTPDWYYVTAELYSNNGTNPIYILDDGSHIYNESRPSPIEYTSVIFIPQNRWFTNGNAFHIRANFGRINCNSSATINASACETYTVPSGNSTYTSSGTYYDTIANAAGCDSLLTINLTIGTNKSATIEASGCSSYTVPSGDETYFTNGTYMDTIPTVANCDSILTIDLTIHQATTDTISPTACKSYTIPSGNATYYSSGTYTDTILNAAYCDSIITINLTINTPDTMVSQNNDSLIAHAAAASYQWLDCDNNYAPIGGATNQSFAPSSNGNYAVEVTQDGCTDTSSCYNITGLGVFKNEFDSQINVYPNPTSGNITIDLGSSYQGISAKVYNVNGQLRSSHQFGTLDKFDISIDGASGYYLIELTSADGSNAFMKILKEQN